MSMASLLLAEQGRHNRLIPLSNFSDGLSDAAENEQVFALTLSAIERAARAGLDTLPGDEKNRIVLDLGRGIRHQPLIALLAAIYIEHLPQYERVEIEHVYSASRLHDPQSGKPLGKAEVRDLKGVIKLGKWIFALGAFDASGNTGVFTEALRADRNNEDAVILLHEGARLERATRTEAAAGKIKEAIERLDATAEKSFALKGAGAAFAPKFNEALEWVDESGPFLQHRRLARRHLDYEDWLRAATLMFEACRIRLVTVAFPDKPTGDYNIRKDAQARYQNPGSPKFDERRKCPEFEQRQRHFGMLRMIRDALAHADDPKPEVAGIVEAPDRLAATLERLYAELLEDKDAFP